MLGLIFLNHLVILDLIKNNLQKYKLFCFLLIQTYLYEKQDLSFENK